jgi:hypothetical protein
VLVPRSVEWTCDAWLRRGDSKRLLDRQAQLLLELASIDEQLDEMEENRTDPVDRSCSTVLNATASAAMGMAPTVATPPVDSQRNRRDARTARRIAAAHTQASPPSTASDAEKPRVSRLRASQSGLDASIMARGESHIYRERVGKGLAERVRERQANIQSSLNERVDERAGPSTGHRHTTIVVRSPFNRMDSYSPLLRAATVLVDELRSSHSRSVAASNLSRLHFDVIKHSVPLQVLRDCCEFVLFWVAIDAVPRVRCLQREAFTGHASVLAAHRR